MKAQNKDSSPDNQKTVPHREETPSPEENLVKSEVVEALKEALPDDEDFQKVMSVVARAEVSTSYSGPLPHADQYERYEKVCPGAAERILSYMEKEQEHRHSLEKKTMTTRIKEGITGQWMAFALMLLLVLMAFFCVYTKQPPAVILAFLAVPLLGVVRKFIEGRKG